MILHFHSTISPNSGELKRMCNIDNDITTVVNEKSVEIVTYDSRNKKSLTSFKLSGNVVKKYYIPLYKHIGGLTMILIYLYMSIRYRPSFVVFEMFIRSSHYVKLIKKITPRCKLVYDIHGAAAEEWAYQGKTPEEVSRKRQNEGVMINSVDMVICQSDEMKKYIIEQYKINEGDICVYRCGVDTSKFYVDDKTRSIIRAELGVKDDEYLFVYSGGMHPWQRVSESIEFFEEYHKKYGQTKLLVLTTDREGYLRTINDLRINNQDNHIMTTALSFEEVPAYLNACDFGFLLRHYHVMNAVASPTKLAEYLACGLMVITSEVAKKWVNNEGLEYLFFENELEIEKMIEVRRNTDRVDIFNYANSYLSLKVDHNNLQSFLIN